MNPQTPYLQTSLVVTSAPGFLPIGRAGNQTSGFLCFPVVITCNERVERVLTPHCEVGLPVSSRLQKIAANPRRAAAVASARSRLADWISNEPSIQSAPLASLRLKAGLSQTELAAKLNTSQPNIARFEKSPGNATLESIKGWASALGVPLLDVIAAIESTNAVGEKSCE